MFLGPAAITGAQITATFIFALASIYLVRTLSTHEFGRATFGINGHLLLLTVAGFGLTTGVIAEIARGRGAGGIAWPTVHALLVVRVLSAAPVVVVGFLWAAVAGDIVPALAGVAASTFLVVDFLIGVLAGQLRSGAVAAVLVAQPACYGLLLVVLDVTRAELVLGAMIAALAFTLALAVLVQSGGARRAWRRPAVSLAPMRHAFWIARYAYVMTFLQIGLLVLPIVLFGTLGRYAQGAALSIIMTLVRFVPEALSLMIVSAYFPRLRALPADGDERSALFHAFARLIGLISIPAALGLAVLGQPLLNLLFAGRYDYLAPELAIASVLVVALPIEALLTWTLVTDGAARTAVVALAARLAIVLAAASGFAAAFADTHSLDGLMLAYPAAAAVSIGLQLARVRKIRRLRLPVIHMAGFAALTAATFVFIRLSLADSPSSLVVATAVGASLPLAAFGVWLVGRASRAEATV